MLPSYRIIPNIPDLTLTNLVCKFEDLNFTQPFNGPSDCFNMGCVENSPDNWHHAFWSYLSVRVILDLLRASSLMLFEGKLRVFKLIR